MKCYIALFICFATKAIHLELVSDLSTPAFLAALERFICRRGLPEKIHSDDGPNFTGAVPEIRKEVKEFLSSPKFQEAIHNFCAIKQIEWSFIPPSSPSFVGLWESGIKSSKGHLLITLGNSLFNYEQLVTIITKIEACLNSRPLYAESIDPNDIEALTPGHFLLKQALTSLP